MRNTVGHITLIFLLFFLSSLAFAHPAKAEIEESWFRSIFSAQESSQSYVEAAGDINTQTMTSETGSSFLNWTNVQIIGAGAVAQTAGLPEDQVTLYEKKYGKGLLGVVQSGLVALYSPPASGVTYVADLIDSAHIVPRAQAQGLGFSSLDTILTTWKQFRNISYMFFVVVFIAIGFMIMFRTKVGQAAITAQQAIPSIIVALLAVTFSYAIAGFLIDLMYLSMYMIIGLFSGSDGPELLSQNFFSVIALMFNNTILGETGTISTVQQSVEQAMEDFLNIGVIGQALSWLSSLAATTIVGIAMLIGAFKIFFELLKSYITIIIQVVFAPVILMLGAIPGKNTFASWIKNLAGNLIVWPVLLLCILVERMLTEPIRSLGNDAVNSQFGGGFMPPFLFGQGQASIVPVIIGLGILLVIPEIMKQVKKAIGVDEGPFGALAGAAVKQVQEGLPIGSKIAGSTLGSLPGAAYGTAKGIVDTKDLKGFDRVRNVFRTSGHYAGEGMARGSKIGTSASSAFGGKTPSFAKPIENITDKTTNYFGEEETLKRMAEGDNWLERKKSKDWQSKAELARAQRARKVYDEQRLKEGLYGQEVVMKQEEK